MIRVVQFSGGKDSTALVLWAREQWGDDFVPLFADTGWEHRLTYEYIQHINETVLGLRAHQRNRDRPCESGSLNGSTRRWR